MDDYPNKRTAYAVQAPHNPPNARQAALRAYHGLVWAGGVGSRWQSMPRAVWRVGEWMKCRSRVCDRRGQVFRS